MDLTQEIFFELMNKLFEPLKINSFPGNLPVALHKDKLFSLAFGYICALKADGERVFLYIANNKAFIVNRNVHIQYIGTCLNQDKDLIYLFDAEYISDKNLLLLFDTLTFQSKNTTGLHILQRVELLRMFTSAFGTISKEEKDTSWQCKSQFNTCFITITNIIAKPKPIFPFHQLKKVLSNHTPTDYPIDGIIFTRELCGYSPFCADEESILKWKQTHTLDFLIVFNDKTNNENKKNILCAPSFFQEQDGNVILYCVMEDNHLKPFSFATLHLLHIKDNIIGEFEWFENKWKFIKARDDKKQPNVWKTISSTLELIQFPITVEHLTFGF